MIKVENLSKIFHQGFLNKQVVKAVDDVSMRIEKGKTFGLIGMSGCGKSTLGRMILKLIPQNEGRIFFENLEISNYHFKDMKPLRKEMQILFQHPDASLNPRMTIGKSLREPFLIHQLETQQEPKEAIEEGLRFVGLSSEVLSRYPHQISGGQIQRICLARVLMLRPKFIVLDEPTSMLDVSVQAQVIEVLKKAQKEFGISYLFISHDLDLIRSVSDTIGVMYEGKLVEVKSTLDFANHPEHPYSQKLLRAFDSF